MDKNNNMILIAIVAIVAIVGMVVMLVPKNTSDANISGNAFESKAVSVADYPESMQKDLNDCFACRGCPSPRCDDCEQCPGLSDNNPEIIT
jgi:hypothetical protein